MDGLRGLAIALVLWHHLFAPYLPAGRVTWLGYLRAGTELAWCGVDLFFVLSGFFIGGILIDQRNSPRLARTFYWRRGMRILPLYFLTLAAIFGAIALPMAGAYQAFSAWVYAFFLTPFFLAAQANWDWLPLSLLWSLAVEEQFYLVAPWVVRAVSPARLPRLALTLALSAWAARLLILIYFPHGHFAAHVLMPLRMDGLALGAWVAWAMRAEAAQPFFRWLELRRGSAFACALATVAGVAALRPAEGSAVLCLFGYTVIALFFALTVAIVAGAPSPPVNRLLSSRVLTHLGRHSYFIYLWHALLGLAIVQTLGGEAFKITSPATVIGPLAAVGVTWLAATVSWRVFEGPLVAWGRRHRY